MNSSKYYETYKEIKDNADLKERIDPEHWNNILAALLFTNEHSGQKYKFGQVIEFVEQCSVLQGTIVAVRNDNVEVVCRGGFHYFPIVENIIRVVEREVD